MGIHWWRTTALASSVSFFICPPLEDCFLELILPIVATGEDGGTRELLGYLGEWDSVNAVLGVLQSVFLGGDFHFASGSCVEEEAVVETCLMSLSVTYTGVSESYGKTQAYLLPHVIKTSGPFHCPVGRSFYFTKGLELVKLGFQCFSMAKCPKELTLRLLMTKSAWFRIWWGELYLKSPSCNLVTWCLRVWCALSTIACPVGYKESL